MFVRLASGSNLASGGGGRRGVQNLHLNRMALQSGMDSSRLLVFGSSHLIPMPLADR